MRRWLKRPPIISLYFCGYADYGVSYSQPMSEVDWQPGYILFPRIATTQYARSTQMDRRNAVMRRGRKQQYLEHSEPHTQASEHDHAKREQCTANPKQVQHQ